jgi:hypothetical protein
MSKLILANFLAKSGNPKHFDFYFFFPLPPPKK